MDGNSDKNLGETLEENSDKLRQSQTKTRMKTWAKTRMKTWVKPRAKLKIERNWDVPFFCSDSTYTLYHGILEHKNWVYYVSTNTSFKLNAHT